MAKFKYISANDWFVDYLEPLISFRKSKGEINSGLLFDNFEERCVDAVHALFTKVDPKEEHWGDRSHSYFLMEYIGVVNNEYNEVIDSKWFAKGEFIPPKSQSTKKKKPKKKAKK